MYIYIYINGVVEGKCTTFKGAFEVFFLYNVFYIIVIYTDINTVTDTSACAITDYS